MSWKQAGVNFIRMAVLLVLVSMAAFFLVSVSPLDPLTTNVGQAALGSMSSEQIARLQEYWGVNTPPVTRYLAWAGDFLKGDMGISLLYRRPVAQVIGEKLANSLWIMAAALSITGISNIALHTREKMAQVMESDYVLFARARGESEWSIIRRHGIRNILLPAMTLQFASVSEIFGGSVLVEQVFSYPGLGQAAVTAGLGGDVPLLMGITIISAAIVFLGNFTANLLYGTVDPRIRRSRA